MKNLITLKQCFVLLLMLTSFSLISCSDDDERELGFVNYGMTSDYYGSNPSAKTIRDAAVGKWYDANGTLMLDIEKWQLNPDFPQTDPTKPYEHEYEYYQSTYFDGYNFPNKQWIGEGSIYKNNISAFGMHHLMIEGNEGYLFIMRNQVQQVRVFKK